MSAMPYPDPEDLYHCVRCHDTGYTISHGFPCNCMTGERRQELVESQYAAEHPVSSTQEQSHVGSDTPLPF